MDDDTAWGLVISGAEAKAIQEVAKATGKITDAAAGAGRYLAAVFGQLPHNTAGILGDAVERARARLAFNAAKKLRERNVEFPEMPSPSVLLPLLEKAEQETRPELAELWAGLLATALEPGRTSHVRRQFFEILADLEPLDALVLGGMLEFKGRQMLENVFVDKFSQDHELNTDRVSVSVEHLQAHNLVNRNSGSLNITPLGVTLIEACTAA